MDLSVVIVSYNVSGYLKACLESVIQATEFIDAEIFVVDNNSSDDSCSMVSSEFPGVTLIRNNTNTGYAAANNQALKLCRGRYVLLLNPDTIVMANTFTKCIGFMDSHIDAGALGVKMTDGDGIYLPESKRSLPSVSSAFFKSFGLSFLFPESKLFNKYYLLTVGNDETAETEVIAGAFMLIRKNVLDITGLLDEDFFMYGEDIDMSYRIIQAGFRNYYFPETNITHYKGRSTPRDNYKDILDFYKAMRIYVRKRRTEGLFRFSHFILDTGIFFRETLALFNRFLTLKFRR
ncbi:MAG: glycosyltransferase family 2 protein [Bacteroidetes bacterium]|nr:glycosyltransferase family 2 protein [Bacteroidota bacterium]